MQSHFSCKVSVEFSWEPFFWLKLWQSEHNSEQSELYFRPLTFTKLRCLLRPRPRVSGYYRIRNFFFPDTATVHTHQANSTANPEKINPLSKVERNKSATNPITCGRVNPDIFESDDVKSVSSLLPNNKPIWLHNVSGEQSKSPAIISLYGA